MLDPSVNIMDVSYICPDCEIRYPQELNYMPEHDAYYTKAHWCKCGARHRIEYWIHITRKGEVKFKLIEFISNDKRYDKRFKILNSNNRRKI